MDEFDEAMLAELERQQLMARFDPDNVREADDGDGE